MDNSYLFIFYDCSKDGKEIYHSHVYKPFDNYFDYRYQQFLCCNLNSKQNNRKINPIKTRLRCYKYVSDNLTEKDFDLLKQTRYNEIFKQKQIIKI